MEQLQALLVGDITRATYEILQGPGAKAVYDAFPVLLVGSWITIKLTVISVGIGLIIGLFMGLFRLSQNKLLYGFSSAYVDFFRGTPLLVQIFLIYFGVLPLLMESVNPFFAAFRRGGGLRHKQRGLRGGDCPGRHSVYRCWADGGGPFLGHEL